jgi:hypothetical protein
MDTELIYKYEIIVFSTDGHELQRVPVDHWEFPSDDEIKNTVESIGGKFARVDRTYWVDEIPFT